MSPYRQITTHLADYKSYGDGAARILLVMEKVLGSGWHSANPAILTWIPTVIVLYATKNDIKKFIMTGKECQKYLF